MTTSKQGMMESIEFTKSDAHIAELLGRLHEMADLQALAALAQWDQHTAMPPGAAEVRGHQMATLEGLLHERWTAARMGTLLDELESTAKQANFTAADHGLIHSVRRGYNRMAKLPRTLVEEMARTNAGSIEAWVKARRQNDFASFAPWLQRTLNLQREVADRVGFTETRYDALLDEYEPGLTARKVESLFAPVREVSTTLLQRIQNSGHTVDASCLQGYFPKQQQLELADKALRGMGYDFTRGQVALSAHPFTTSFGSPFDVRLTVRINERYLQMTLMAALHEGGHAVYEQGSAPTLVRTLVAGGASLGVHESQSRLWENYLGRSEPYWQGQYAILREVFPERFANVDVATFVRALNKVEPSLIRVEADEVTYNLHILIRFELEKALVNGEISVESLPELWNAKYRAYLDIEAPDNSDGVLQDMHWSGGFGYFPTYTLGNLYAAQIFSKLHKEFPDFDARLATGDTGFVLQWLHDHLYVYGAIYQPEELIERVTGEKPDPQYFVRYLTSKFEKVYGL
jgi:carboxypeptidase Taq